MHNIGKEEVQAVRKVIMDNQFMRYRGGETGYVERFEKALCKKLDVKHALTMNSGTSALISALVGLNIGPGDEVLVPAFTWVATALAPLAVGAVPVLVDIDETLTIDPRDVEKKITRHTKAIIPVHVCNLVCDMKSIMRISRKYKLAVCEDACQAVGLQYKNKYVGAIGHAGTFSFNQYKNITCGEGGALLTNDDTINERALIYHDTGCYTRSHASKITHPFFAGVNYRASEIQGAILHVQLKRLNDILKKLHTRRKLLAELLSQSKDFKVAPHNDPNNAIGIMLLFKTPRQAKLFSQRTGCRMMLESSRHVYTNWEPIMSQETFHPKMNPYKWAKRKIKYRKDMCKESLQILSRMCNVPFLYDTPIPEIRKFTRKLLSVKF